MAVAKWHFAVPTDATCYEAGCVRGRKPKATFHAVVTIWRIRWKIVSDALRSCVVWPADGVRALQS